MIRRPLPQNVHIDNFTLLLLRGVFDNEPSGPTKYDAWPSKPFNESVKNIKKT